MNPLISVIIPAHNSENTIDVAIQSMLHQTWKNLEVIVVDDNSTDTTEKIVADIAQNDSRLKYYKLPYDDPYRINKHGRNINAGYMARNYGLEKVQGEWITFQDADDSSFLNRIEAQYQLALQYNALHVCVDWQQLKPELLNLTLDYKKYLTPENIIDSKEIYNLSQKTRGIAYFILGPLAALIPFEWKRLRVINKLFFGSLDAYPGTGNSPLFKKEIISKVTFRQLNNRVWPSFVGRGADRDFNFQVALTFKKSFTFFIPLYLWRQNSQNTKYEN